MIKIELVNGTTLDNDPQYGWNLDSVGEIKECLETGGGYRWTPAPSKKPNTILLGTTLYRENVRHIYEA